MIIKFTADVLIGTGLGVIVGAFLPSVGRKIKALWIKETQLAEKVVYNEYEKIDAKVKSKL